MKTVSLLVALVLAPASAFAAPPAAPAIAVPHAIEVSAARVHLHDLVAVGTQPDVDLGPAPALGGTRTIDRDDVVRALGAASATGPTPKLAPQYRVSRKVKKLAGPELEKLVRAGLDPARLTKGIAFTGVRSVAAQVPDGYDRVTVELPAYPRKAGPVTVTASLAFLGSEGEVIARITVPVDFAIPPEALVPDIAKGGGVTLVIQKGLVEVSMPAVANADGDLGNVLPVMLKPSGRIVRARLVDKDHAVALEES
ncbi:MAG: hypothetical protein JWP97_1960 [Labilithrix sp.]|nr:hypothetical protein [Labilithrix sp.]